jgi:hypothetical protein
MNRKQLLKIIHEIDNQCAQLTLDKIEELACGDGTYSILENAIDSVITEKEANKAFWDTYQSVTYEGTPKENHIDFLIIEKYFDARINEQFQKLRINSASELITNMKRDIITNISDDCLWIDYILKIQELI